MPKIFETGREKYFALKNWYEKYEERIGTGSLLTGFIFDSLTMQRIDAWRENLWIALNLLVVGFCIIFLNRKEGSDPKSHFWLFTILQFSFGSILGSFFIFYFRSASLSVSWPFLLILLAAMIANELFQKRYARLALQISFFYLSIYTFAIFLVPIVLHSMGAWVFILSGLMSLFAIWIFHKLLKKFATHRYEEGGKLLKRVVAVIFICVNILYFTNLIPPIPLSLKDGGIYHGITKNPDGSYTLLEERRKGILNYFHLTKSINLPRGDSLYAYTAIFSPANLDTNIVHEWQYFDMSREEWVTSTRIPLRLSGGRAEGFRTYSTKSNLSPGKWRVNVSNPRGQVLGRINFQIFESRTSPSLETIVKE